MPNKSLTMMTLNVGRMLQPRTREFLVRLAAGGEGPIPDVLCLQDIPFRDLPLFERWPHVAFAPMTNHLINGERAVVGVAMVSQYFMTSVAYHTTWGDGVLKDLQGVDNNNQRIAPTVENDRLIEATEDRVAICTTVVKDERKYNLATTHGFWVRGGVVNDQQRESTRKLLAFLSREGRERDGLLLAGDLNFGRGGEIYELVLSGGNDRTYLVGGFRDLMPSEIDNTRDLEYPDPDQTASHRGVKVVTDWFFDLGRHDRMFILSDVRLRSGVSDHCALSATAKIEYGL